MNKQQLLMDISLEVDTFNAHLKRLSKSDYPLHNLDIDFLQEKIRLIYERILDLEQFVEVKKTDVQQKTPEIKKTETVIKQEKETFKVNKTEEYPAFDKLDETVIDNNDINADKTVENVALQNTKVEETKTLTDNGESQPVQNEEHKKQEDSPRVVKTTLDLFSDMPSETLSDKISAGEDVSVADRLQKSQIGDLREAIGINEKFQFINELFNGDMTRYNKAVDELNSFANLEGAKTYLFELSIENQWSDDLSALIKLNELLERKFA